LEAWQLVGQFSLVRNLVDLVLRQMSLCKNEHLRIEQVLILGSDIASFGVDIDQLLPLPSQAADIVVNQMDTRPFLELGLTNLHSEIFQPFHLLIDTRIDPLNVVDDVPVDVEKLEPMTRRDPGEDGVVGTMVMSVRLQISQDDFVGLRLGLVPSLSCCSQDGELLSSDVRPVFSPPIKNRFEAGFVFPAKINRPRTVYSLVLQLFL